MRINLNLVWSIIILLGISGHINKPINAFAALERVLAL